MASEPTRFKSVHRMVGDLFAPVLDAGQRRERLLAPESVAEFRQRGFVKGPRVLDNRQIEALRDGLERIRRGTNPRLGELYEVDDDYVRAPEQNVFHFLGAWMIDESFHDILFHSTITVPVSQLLGVSKVRFWHDQVFYKPARHPGVVTWHQDYSYWTRSTPPGHITCWIGLDDSTLANGCVQFIPESHRWDLLPKVSLTANMDAIGEYLTPTQRSQFDPTPMLLKAGECSFHDGFTLHGSYGNSSDMPRRAIVLNFMRPDTRSADGTQPLLAQTPIIPAGEIIEGENFPIVHDAEATLV